MGGVFFLGPLGLFNNSDNLSFIMRALASLLGAVGICTVALGFEAIAVLSRPGRHQRTICRCHELGN